MGFTAAVAEIKWLLAGGDEPFLREYPARLRAWMP